MITAESGSLINDISRPLSDPEHGAVTCAPREREPLIYFQARPYFGAQDFCELWQHRELIYSFAYRDLRVRYRQTIIGLAWVLLQPLSMMVVFAVIFGLLGKEPTSGSTPYALVAMCGLLTWQLFASVLQQSSNSLVVNQALVSKVYFPRLVLPIAASLCPLLDFLIGMSLFLVIALACGEMPGWPLLMLPWFALGTVLAAWSLGFWFSALHALYRDIGYLISFLIQIGFFVCPVIYETSGLIPPEWRTLFAINPLVTMLDGMRWSVLSTTPPHFWPALVSLGVMAVGLTIGLTYFRHTERSLADRI